VTLAETSFAGGLGLEIDLTKVPYQGQKEMIICFFQNLKAVFSDRGAGE